MRRGAALTATVLLAASTAIAACGGSAGGGAATSTGAVPADLDAYVAQAEQTAEPVPVPADPCAAAPPAGDQQFGVLAGTPPVRLHVPAGLRGGRRVPLVLGLHGAGQTGADFEGSSDMSVTADRHRFLVAYPQSWRPRNFWRYPERDNPRAGLRLLRATIGEVARRACVDRRRVFVTGISSGGRMTYAAGCELADIVLAIAPVSAGTGELPPCRPANAISVLDLHGTADPIVAYEGRGRRRDGRVRAVMDRWARIDGCDAATQASRPLRRITRFAWRGCRDRVRVEHLRLEGGRHAWPTRDSPYTVPVDAAEMIWRFFARAEVRR